MSATTVTAAVEYRARGHASPGTVLAALVPGAIVLLCHLVLAWFAGRVDLFTSAAVYKVVMNVAVFGRFFGLFAAVILVWGAVRSKGAPRRVLGLAILSGPVVYALTAIGDLLPIFPIGQAVYYGLNPMFVAAVGSQCAMAAVGESLWRMWSRRPGSPQDSAAAVPGGPVVTWRIVTVAVLGFAVLFLAVLYKGGVAYFFLYQQGYLWLFT